MVTLLITGTRGQGYLIHDDFIFTVNQRSDKRIFWVCIGYPTFKCRCRCSVGLDGVVRRSPADHNHPDHSEKIMNKLVNESGTIKTWPDSMIIFEKMLKVR